MFDFRRHRVVVSRQYRARLGAQGSERKRTRAAFYEGRCEMGGVYIGGGALLVIVIIILIVVLL